MTSKRNRRKTAPEITIKREKRVSLTTVERGLREGGLFDRIALRKTLLRKQNKIKRLQWGSGNQH